MTISVEEIRASVHQSLDDMYRLPLDDLRERLAESNGVNVSERLQQLLILAHTLQSGLVNETRPTIAHVSEVSSEAAGALALAAVGSENEGLLGAMNGAEGIRANSTEQLTSLTQQEAALGSLVAALTVAAEQLCLYMGLQVPILQAAEENVAAQASVIQQGQIFLDYA